MTSNRAIIILLILILLLSLVGGCTRYATSGKVMDRIEKKVEIKDENKADPRNPFCQFTEKLFLSLAR